MRNLKRALSLALASVMVLGLMVVGTGASYDDVTSEQNLEAIEVLQEIGVMVGDDNGNFNPDSTVTRNEMAVVVSNLMDYRVATYAGTSPFTDVPSWAEPYVAACWTNGNIAGYSATIFGGSDPVTTSQAALMLMKALGYFQYQSDFNGDWQLATISQGNKIDLFTNVDSNVREAMTRNDLAQLVLNTLKSGTVEADDDTIKVNTGDVSVEAGKVNYNYITSGETYARTIKSLNVAGSLVNSGQTIVELGEKLYQGDLKMREDVSDDFGRPGTRWTYKTTAIGTYSDAPAQVFTAKMSKDNLYDLLGKDVIDDYFLAVYEDGVRTSSVDGNGDPNQVINTTYAQANSSSASCNSGKGVRTEVFVDSDKELVTIVVTNTYLMQATGDYNESRGTVAVSTLTTPTGGLSTSVNSLADDDFANVADMAEDDYILYTYAQGKVQTAVKAEVLQGEVTAYSASANKTFSDAGGSVTIDGTKYDYAKYAAVDAENGCATTFNVGNSAAIVVDAYGYALYVDDASLSVGNYVYIDAVAPETTLSTKTIADAYFYDGTNETITLKPGTTLAGAAGRTDIRRWYSYSRNSNGEYTLALAGTTGNSTASSITNNRIALFNGVKYAGGGAETVTGNNNTIFIIKDDDDKITTYTGVANVPDITIDTVGGGSIAYMRDKDDNSKSAILVFVDAGDDGRVKSTTDSLLYTVKRDSAYVDNTDNEPVERWFVVLDGALTTVETKESWSAKSLYEDYSVDSNGYYETGSGFDFPDDSDKDTITLTQSRITQSGDTLSLAGTSAEGYSTTSVIGSDTKISLIMIPDNKGNSYPLSGEVMDDNNADYQVTENMTARSLANMFRDRVVTGRAFVVYEDKGDSDLATRIYVEVTSCSKTSNSLNALTAPTLTGATYSQGASATPLNGTTTTANSGTVSYQWYSSPINNTSGGSPISLAINATYTPVTTVAGTTYYYVVVTDTTADGSSVSVTSNIVRVSVNGPEAPTISAQPAADTTVTAGSISGSLTITATVADGGTLSYQWKQGSTSVGTNSNSLTIPTGLTAGTYEFTCEVTNTLTGYSAKTTSSTAVVTVRPVAPAMTGTAGDSGANTVTITAGGNYPQGIYKLYADGSTTNVIATTEVSSDGTSVVFNVPNGTLSSGSGAEFEVTVTIGGVESAQTAVTVDSSDVS